MFEKILIANRGEIACRIIRTCQRLGIGTVAVHSAADAMARHVAMADEKVAIGPAPAAESYLRIDRIVEACRQTGAQAVHPGYGFLSENAELPLALAAAGIVFIGPPVEAIRAMGDKIESKRLARAAGVSTVPGTLDAIGDPTQAREIAAEIGYPVMVKASAGGGGKGMRIARSERELDEGLERARSEARSSFGDDRVFIEKFVEEPRHIEIQVLGDRHGRTLHLGERECSIQRRHQKVIEEAPSPFLDAATRSSMGAQAVELARAVGYHSAGTVEFIVDKDRHFYFLEMNTRLQVEHPVTELVTGIDLVEQMIRVAAGERLAFDQPDIRLDGWAIEARVYAEDPARGFLPSTGRLVTYIEPSGPGVRCDSGVVEGGEVSLHYDPMIAKLCVHAPDRPAAIARLAEALDNFVIQGPGHNLSFLNAVVSHPRFAKGSFTTGFIAEEYGEKFTAPALDEATELRLVALASAMRARQLARAQQISGRLPGVNLAPPTSFVAYVSRTARTVEAVERDGAFAVSIDGGPAHELVLHWRPGLPLARASIDGEMIAAGCRRLPEGFALTHRGSVVQVLVRRRRAHELALLMPEKVPADTSKMLLSPMPGMIVMVDVVEGDLVKAGQTLCVLEAMKMENVLKAERDGIIATVSIAERDTVSADQVLMTFE
ncbi:MAG: acetyl/propionyl/methylcrotonyl-CoA carboxylase subunit alpha [Geminicoccaceae bacterium]|nr:acetyl/propionyl/methylcrotonyl-CoA carboxylase subunit alpha [Geminicoccaceae bacterium]HRY23704.1 acetyl/propionyl/methylcrotonyl-CoA carboxylase subunit alpha [Geminicoccaceae bacterium]